jgi:hypothetical protein
MFVGIGSAEKNILVYLALEPSATARDIHSVFPKLHLQAIRRAMKSLAAKGGARLDKGPPMRVYSRVQTPAPPVRQAQTPAPPIRQAQTPPPAIKQAPAPAPPIRQAPAPQPIRQAPAPAVFLSAADAYAARVAREIERQKAEAIGAGARTVV